jgi:GxxExxY protein
LLATVRVCPNAFVVREGSIIGRKSRLHPDDLVLGIYFPPLVVERKAVEKVLPIREAQRMTYLRLSKTHVGLLINFNVHLLKEGLKRMVL